MPRGDATMTTSRRVGWKHGRRLSRTVLAAAIAVGMTESWLSSATAQTGGTGKASGKPIVIGIYTPADNATFTAPELIDGAQAAVKYVNNNLDGLGGRHKVFECHDASFNPSSPQGSEVFPVI